LISRIVYALKKHVVKNISFCVENYVSKITFVANYLLIFGNLNYKEERG